MMYRILLLGILARMTMTNWAVCDDFTSCLGASVWKSQTEKETQKVSEDFVPVFFPEFVCFWKVCCVRCTHWSLFCAIFKWKLDDELLKAWNVFFSSFCQSGRPIQCDSMLVLSAFVCDRSIKSTIKWWMCLKQMKSVCSMFVFTAKKLEQSKRQKKRKHIHKEIQLKRYFKHLKKGKNSPKVVQRDREVKNKAQIRNKLQKQKCM